MSEPVRRTIPRPWADWREENLAHLALEIERLRLLLDRETLWNLRPRRSDTDDLRPARDREVMTSWLDADALSQRRRFFADDPACQRIAARLSETEAHLAAGRRSLATVDGPPPVEAVVAGFELSDFERDVLILALAPLLDASLALRLASAQGSADTPYPTAELALRIFTDRWSGLPAALHAFQPHATLRRSRLLACTEPATFHSEIGVDERVAGFLLGYDHPDEEIETLLAPLPRLELTEAQANLAETLAAWMNDRLARGLAPRLNLCGTPGSGRAAVARVICDRLGFEVRRLAPPSNEAETARGIGHRIARDAVLSRFLLYVEHDGSSAADAALRVAPVLGTLLELGIPCVVASRHPLPDDRLDLAIEVPKPGRGEQAELWRRALEDAGAAPDETLDDSLVELTEDFDLGASDIGRRVTEARALARTRGADPPTLETIRALCRRRGRESLDAVAHRIDPQHGWHDLVLPPDTEASLRELTAQLAHRRVVYRQWGFGEKLSRGRGISALFQGPSGTGKTTAAEVIAGELDLDLYRVDLATVVSKYIGETEKNLGRVFDAAERSGAILFFDEADALFGKRSEVKDSHDRYANVEIAYLLQRMEDYGGLAILATNLKANLDDAFARRLRFVVKFPMPDAAARRRIWKVSFPPSAPVGELDLDTLGRLELSGGNIHNVAINAAFLAARDRGPIAMRHVMAATRRELEKEEKLVDRKLFAAWTDPPDAALPEMRTP